MNVLAYLQNLFQSSPKTKFIKELKGLDLADAICHNLMVEKRIPGMAITIKRQGKIVLEKGYGHADLEKKIKVNPAKTLFRIASISKCITGIALAKMVEEEMVELDASFYEYVPNYPKKKYDFTLRQLASHTAGIRGYRGKEFALNKPYSIEESVEIFQNDPLVFRPGKGYLYNSFDFVLLSLAMQEASGIPFETYVKTKVLEPLGMMATIPEKVTSASLSNQELVGERSQTYTRTKMGFKKAVPVNNFYKLAGGGYLSTSSDIAKLGQAIMEKKLIQPETLKDILTAQTINGKSTYYGLGFQVSQDDLGRDFVGHVGNSVGAYSNFFVYPNEEIVISILINCTDPKVQNDLDTVSSTQLSSF
ncbi:beta-lactamase family protein [Flagellimonas sp. HMM57]|uniref:serine hydrolase domain-containing protein n=1 Tax=unclassified Flagellimonas TaxID=2644544 RepID=UPI0013D0E7F3|nr:MULTISPECIES: serine hydrolase domain-containing protein [unclassified Flagellimonas]UII76852.1 beta-lactamase family protein [Flagellimonas sp. HMM57]